MLHKLFGQDNNQTQGFPDHVANYRLHEHHKRSLIGWIANRMGQLLHLESSESGKLIYVSFSNVHIHENKENIEEYLIYLASCLLSWLEKGQDVYLQIKESGLCKEHHQCLLHVYEEIKEDIYRYFPQKLEEPADRDKEDAIWNVYRDVIYAVTQQKFLLIRESEIDPYKQGDIMCEAAITERSDIPKARELAKQSLLDNGVPAAKVMSHILLISEAITNILKHAYKGKLTLIKGETMLHVLVEDSGPGFPLKLLPNTTLMAGYSTKKSLGQGFTLMMKIAQQVVLSTIPNVGTTLILVFAREDGVIEGG
ncbi:ATP-binding protein [Paenibacillus alginolyticus]|uniref:ATP-binding protein n=1 Tax=Paenibacillus alginolyticus TaxID=59839 RepID=UPI001FEC7A17|nr:ATP-binding protein [Paenibacillus frigoriresistens]